MIAPAARDESLDRWLDVDGSVMVSVQLRKIRVGWLLTERYGPVSRRSWILRAWKTRAPHGAAVCVADAFAERAGWRP